MSEDWPGRGAPRRPDRGSAPGDARGRGPGQPRPTRALGPDDRATELLPRTGGGPLLGGRYRLERRLGGEPGVEFHQATDQRDGRPVGVTLFTATLDEAAERRFLDQARPLLAVRHPGLVGVLGAGVDRVATERAAEDHRGWLAREEVEGHTLGAELRQGPLPPTEVAGIGAQAAAALAEAHDHGLTHRDIGPDAVVLGVDGRVRVADLGVADLRERTPTTGAQEAYHSPEQVRGEPVGPPADVYALGLTLLEAVTGRVEYPGSGWEAASARLSRPPLVPNEVPASLARALLAMLALTPARRPSVREAAALLDGAAHPNRSGPPPAVTHEPVEEPSGTSPGRRVALLALPVLGLLVLVAILVAVFSGSDDDTSGSTPTASGSGSTTTATPRATGTPSTRDSDGTRGASPSFSLPDFSAPELPKASDVERAVSDKVKDKVKEQVDRSFTDKVQDAWQSVKDWFANLAG